MLSSLFDSVLQLIVRTSTDLPPDVRAALRAALAAETPGTLSAQALAVIARNIDQAAAGEAPMCQDTGLPWFKVRVPRSANQTRMRAVIAAAVAEATRRGVLRPNSVDSVTGRNSGDNLGPGTPVVHLSEWERDDIEIVLLLKGGGSENVSAQYSLPCDLAHLGRADRTLDGVRSCVLHAVWQAQGRGCSPGVVGVCIGGDRASGYLHAKEQLLRCLDDANPDPSLAELEASVMGTVNTLGIGAMGFGGAVTLVGCKIGALNRLPASYFVSVAYDCWAFRRLGIRLDGRDGSIREWLYRDPSVPVQPMVEGMPAPRSGREVPLNAPIDEATARSLRVGDLVLISGRMYTGRDAVHAHLATRESPVDLRGGVLYHCGPVVIATSTGWRVVAAGPTTSIREEPYQAEVIRRHGIRVVVGKGGMGGGTLAALAEAGAVYVSAVGGAAQTYARCIERVDGVSFSEFGVPEALWHLWVRDFPAVVTMDAHGRSLHDEVASASGKKLRVLGVSGGTPETGTR